jgi:hypothetical protein
MRCGWDDGVIMRCGWDYGVVMSWDRDDVVIIMGCYGDDGGVIDCGWNRRSIERISDVHLRQSHIVRHVIYHESANRVAVLIGFMPDTQIPVRFKDAGVSHVVKIPNFEPFSSFNSWTVCYSFRLLVHKTSLGHVCT